MEKPNLKPYPAYKPSGVPWLQQVPEHWSEMKVKHIFRERVQKGYADEPLLAATQSKGVVTKEVYGLRTVEAQKDLHLLKLVEKGDFVISLRSFQGGIEISHSRGIISPAYTILRSARPCDAGYLKFLLKSAPFIDGLKLFITGIREGQNIDYSRLARTHLPWPRLEEQQSIAKYLQALDTKVKRYIRTKRKLIAALQEQKQAIIQRAVTRGLDTKVKLKPSGVEWLGEVPEHWEVVKLKRLASVKGRIGFRGYTTSDLVEKGKGALALGASHITSTGGINIAEPVFISWEKYHESPEIMVDRNDLIVVQRGSCGKVALVDVDLGPATINPSLVLLKRLKVEPKFLLNVLLGGYIQNMIARQTSSTAVPMLSQKQIENFDVILPPKAEQREIAELLTRETEKVDKPLAHAEQAIARMQEYHTRLIADVVTGAVDVRAAAQALPVQPIDQTADEPMEEEPLSMAAEGEAEYGDREE